MDSYERNIIESLRAELVSVVEHRLTPVSLEYGYSDNPLENAIKWRPCVLILGNYSSGKSTLINELLGAEVQRTGQAPTDDCFTVLTHAESNETQVRTVEERDGGVLLNNPEYPFSDLKKHGARFAAHFRLKKINAPFLRSLSLIDTPGMLDSVSEQDRGYDYQEVIGQLAQIADLILVLFDPHKAGTIRETYESLRQTLPRSTYEDRVLFVLNRVDECENLNDLIRVYGTLCWNLSQMTGRKDVPPIHLTYSPSSKQDSDFLGLLKNQREEITAKILQAPKYRLDHLAAFVEEKAQDLTTFLTACQNYVKGRRKFTAACYGWSLFSSALIGLVTYVVITQLAMSELFPQNYLPGLGASVALVCFIVLGLLVKKWVLPGYHRRTLRHLDDLIELKTNYEREAWERVRESVSRYLERCRGKISYGQVRADLKRIGPAVQKVTKDARKALSSN